jgi:hypothetical protein
MSHQQACLISFNNFSGIATPDITAALKELSGAEQTPSADLRIDFGDNSVWARPSSFVMTSSVPEPSGILLVGMGVVSVICLNKRRRQA